MVFGELAEDDKTKLTVRGLDPEAFKAYKSGPNGIIRVSDVVFIDPGEKATLDVTNVETIVFEQKGKVSLTCQNFLRK